MDFALALGSGPSQTPARELEIQLAMWLATFASQSLFVASPPPVRAPQRAPAPQLSEDLDMALLQRRVDAVSRGQAGARLFDLDPMVPGQRLVLPAPAAFVDACRAATNAEGVLCMFGRQGLRINSHGVEVEVESIGDADARGGAEVALRAGRLCRAFESGAEEGSRWLGRQARVRWVAIDGAEAVEGATESLGPVTEAATAELLASLGPLVEEWISLLRSTSRERSPGQLDAVLDDLGPLPGESRPNARALWVAGLINPLPALGVALEVRPAALMAATADERIRVAEFGLRDSIQRLRSPGPPF